MARGGEKISVQIFEEVLQKILEEDKDTDWKHAKKFEHTDVWRKSQDDSSIHIFKVGYSFKNAGHCVVAYLNVLVPSQGHDELGMISFMYNVTNSLS